MRHLSLNNWALPSSSVSVKNKCLNTLLNSPAMVIRSCALWNVGGSSIFRHTPCVTGWFRAAADIVIISYFALTHQTLQTVNGRTSRSRRAAPCRKGSRARAFFLQSCSPQPGDSRKLGTNALVRCAIPGLWLGGLPRNLEDSACPGPTAITVVNQGPRIKGHILNMTSLESLTFWKPFRSFSIQLGITHTPLKCCLPGTII